MNFRVFLSHSSADKAFADIVASDLDRATAIYDRHDFLPGEEFGPEIMRNLAEAGIFALLASPEALASRWVNVEINQAEALRQSGIVAKALVFLLDGVTHNDLPTWLRAAKAVPAISPVQVATHLRNRQAELIDESQRPAFLNRHEELARFERALRSRGPGAALSTKSAAFFGPPGRGRHSLALKAFDNVCGLKKYFTVPLENGDDLGDLVIKLAQFSETYASVDDLQLKIDEIRFLPRARLLEQLQVYLHVLAGDNTLLLLEDAGGLLNPDGTCAQAVVSLLSEVETTPACFAAIVTRRRPQFLGLKPPVAIRITELATEFLEDLAVRYGEVLGVPLRFEDAVELAHGVGGQPLVLRAAIERVNEMGLDLVKSDLDITRRHNLEAYWTLLRSENEIEERHASILVALSYYSPAPLMTIEAATGLSNEDSKRAIERLLDLVLVELDQTRRFFRVSPDLAALVPRVFPEIKLDHDAVFGSFETILRRDPNVPNRLAIERNVGHALLRSSRPDKDRKIIQLAADSIRAAQEAYDEQRWRDAVSAAELALTARPENTDAHRIYVQALAKQSKYSEALAHMPEIERRFEPHEARYFRGFIAQSEHNPEGAIEHFRASINLGRSGFAIHRDLATNYLRVGNLPDAKAEILEAKRFPKGRENRYVLDNEIKIAVLEKNESDARTALAISDRVDRRHHFYQLSGLVETAFGDYDEALRALRRSYEVRNRDSYLNIFLRAVNHIALGSLLEARRDIESITSDQHTVDRVALNAALMWRRNQRGAAKDYVAGYSSIKTLDPLQRFITDHVAAEDTIGALVTVLLHLGLEFEAGDSDSASDE